jgi:hypothetical protein
MRETTAALALLAVLAAGGCAADAGAAQGGTTAAVPVAAAPGEHVPPASGGSIADANARTVAAASAAVRACIHRNDKVSHGYDVAWHKEGRQRSYTMLMTEVFDHLGIEHEGSGRRNDKILNGLLTYDSDHVRHRVILQIDPAVIGIKPFRRWVKAVAVQVSEGRSPRSRVTVTVQRGCFSAKGIDRARKQVDKPRRWDSRSNTVDLDGRLHVSYCGAENVAYAIKLQRRVGPVLAIDEGCVHPV